MPFNRFRQPDGRYVDTVLGPEMKSTGEVMGFDADFGAGVRQGPGRGVRARCPTVGPGVRLDGQPRQADDDLPDQGARRPRLRDPGHPGHRRGAAPQRRATRPSYASTSRAPGRTASRTTVQLIADGDVDLVVNTPHGSSGSGGSVRVDGYEIRTAAVRANVPCITTVQGLGAAVQGIEARIRGDIGVRSLQDWARPVPEVRRGTPRRTVATPVALRPRSSPGSTPSARTSSASGRSAGGRGRCCARPPYARRRRSTAMGLTFPNRARAGRRLRQERRRDRRARGARASASSRSAR